MPFNSGEFLVLIVLAVVILGPDRLPMYAQKLARGIRQLRVSAEGAKAQLKEQLGPEYDDLDWRQYDPRQYDPRRIVREALLDPLDEAISPLRSTSTEVAAAASTAATLDSSAVASVATIDPGRYDPGRPTPYDVDAT